MGRAKGATFAGCAGRTRSVLMSALLHELSDWYLSVLSQGGYWLIAGLMALESTLVPIPSETIIPPAAYLAHTRGELSVIGVILSGTAGSWVGASVMYWAARWLGRPFVMRFGRYVALPPSKIELAERWSARYGWAGVFFSRLLPVIRHLIGIPGGVLKSGTSAGTPRPRWRARFSGARCWPGWAPPSALIRSSCRGRCTGSRFWSWESQRFWRCSITRLCTAPPPGEDADQLTERFFVNCDGLVDGTVPGKLRCPLQAAFYHAGSALALRRRPDRFGHLTHIFRRQQQPRISNNLGNAGHVHGDDRASASHRLEKRKSKPFPTRRIRQRRRSLIEPAKRLVVRRFQDPMAFGEMLAQHRRAHPGRAPSANDGRSSSDDLDARTTSGKFFVAHAAADERYD